MALSDGLGIQALVQSYDKKAVSQAFAEIAKSIGKSVDDLNNDLNKIKIDKDVVNNLVNQLKALPEEVRKKTQGMSFDLFSDLINADDAEEKIDEAFKTFTNKIQSFVKLRDQIGNDKIIIETDYSQIDELIGKTERLLELQEELNKWQSGKSRPKKNINADISDLESQIKSGISNLNVSGEQVGVGVNVDDTELVELDKRIKETEESLKSAREEAEKYGASLDVLKKKVNQAYNKNLEDASGRTTKNFLKAVQEYKKAGGSEKDLSKDELDWYKLAGVSYPKQFIPLDQITNESKKAQQKVQELENTLDDLYKQREALIKNTGSGTGTGDGFGFGASKEEAEELLNTIKEIRDILNQFKENKSLLDSEEINTLKQRIAELDTQFSDIQTKLQNVGKDSFDGTTNDANELLNKLGEVYDQITYIQDKLQGLDDNVFSEMKINIDNLINKFDAMNEQLQEFINLSSNTDASKIKTQDEVNNDNVNANFDNSNAIEGQNKLQSELKETNTEAQKVNKSLEEINKASGDQVAGKVFHGAKTKWQGENFDFSKSGRLRGQLGAGMYFTSDSEKVANFGKAEIKELELSLENCFVITKEYITSISDLYKAMGKELPDNATIKDAMNEMRLYNNSSQENAQSFRKNMLDMGYQGMYVGDNLANKIIPEELVVYDEQKLENLKSFTNNEFKELKETGNIELKISDTNIEKASNDIKNITQDVDIEGQTKFQSELGKTKDKLQEIGTEAQETKQKIEDLGKTDINPGVFPKETPTPSPTPEKTPQQESPSADLSDVKTYKDLQAAIEAVEQAIKSKTEAIQDEEVQMYASVNGEIKKLEELKGKLNEIKTEFENGIASGLFKDSNNEDVDDNNITVPGEITLSPKLSDIFKTDADKLLDDINIEKEAELKITGLNDSNQNIENIKEQIESATEDVNLSDSYNPNQFDELLSKDFSTKGKKEATSQLREAYNEFKQYYNDLNELNTVEGQKAAYNYYKSYEEAINQNISKTNLERYTVGNGIYNNEDLDYQIDLATRSIKLFSEVQNELGNIKIDDSIAEHVGKLTYNLREFEKVKSDLDNNVPRLESVDEVDGNLKSTYSMEATKKEYEELLDTVTYFKTILKSEISYAKEFGETLTQSAQKAESAIAEVNDELNKPQRQQIKPVEGQTGNQDQDEKKSGVIQVPVEPLLDQTSWEKEIDRILEAIGTKKIKIEPDTTSQEWNDFKSYIEKISNLTLSLNLDKNTVKNLSTSTVNSSTTIPKTTAKNTPNALDLGLVEPIETLSKEWEFARKAAKAYVNELSDVVNVTKQIRNNEKTGERLISYRVSDDQGKQVTVGANGRLISYTDQIADQAKIAKEQQKQQEKLLKEQQKQQENYYKELQKQSNEKQQQTEKANIAEANALLEKQSSLFKEIHTTQSEILQLQRTETSTSEDAERLTKEIDSLKEKKKLLQEEYVQNNKNLQQYDSYINKADQLSKLQNISNTFSTKNSADAYKELNSVFKEYESIQTRIAKNEIKGINNDDTGLLEERERVLNRIANIQNQIKTEGLNDTRSDIDFSNRNKELEKNIDLMKAQADAEREVREANKSSKTGFGTNNENLKTVIDLYDRLLTNMQQIKQLQDMQSTRTLSNDEEQYLVKLQDQKIELEQRYNAELEKGYVQTSKIKEVIEETNKLLAKDTSDVDLNSKTFSGRETNIDTAYDEAQKVNSALNRTSALMDELSHKDIANFEKPFDNASIKISLLNQRLASGSINLATYDNSVNRVVSSLRNIVEVLDDTATTTSGIEAMQRHLSELSGGNFTIIDTKTVGTVTTLTAEFEDQDKVIQRVRMSYNDLNKQVAKLGTTGKQSISSFSKFIDELGAKFRNLSTYLLSFVGFYEVWGAIQQGVTYVRELDSALTEMKKVSDENTESLKAFQEESFDIADSVASTAKEIQNSTADWLRLGYAMDEASELARTTAVYKAVGDDMDIATATESMVSTLQGFQLEADQAANIVDQFNEVSNNFAIDSKGIGDALQRSAASFNAANTGMSEAIALITATMKTKWLNIWKHILRIHLIAGTPLELYTTI